MPWRLLFGCSLLVALAGTSGYAYWSSTKEANVAGAAASYKTDEEKNDLYVRFVMEAYDIIEKQYWQKATDEQMAELFTLSINKAGATTTPPASDRAGTARLGARRLAGAQEGAAQR